MWYCRATYKLASADEVERIMYVDSPMGATLALNRMRYFVVEGCGPRPLNTLCQFHTGVTWELTVFPFRSSTITNGFDTRNSTTSSRSLGSELWRTMYLVGKSSPNIIVGRLSLDTPCVRESSMLK